MNNLKKFLDYVNYINKVVEINQSITVINKNNKPGKKLAKILKRNFVGGIDGFNKGADFVGLLPFGEFSVHLMPDDDNRYYVSFRNYQNNAVNISTRVSFIGLLVYLDGINAVRKGV